MWRSFALFKRGMIQENQKVIREFDEFFRKLHAVPPTASSGISISYHSSELSNILFLPAHKPNCNAQSRQVHIGLSKGTRSARMWLMTSAGCCSIGSNYSENNFKRSFRGFWTRNALSSALLLITRQLDVTRPFSLRPCRAFVLTIKPTCDTI